MGHPLGARDHTGPEDATRDALGTESRVPTIHSGLSPIPRPLSPFRGGGCGDRGRGGIGAPGSGRQPQRVPVPFQLPRVDQELKRLAHLVSPVPAPVVLDRTSGHQPSVVVPERFPDH